jgi:hypothetical protein
MAKTDKNLPLETDFYPNQKAPKAQDGPHEYRDGEYVTVPAPAAKYPKVKYHADYIHQPKADKILGYTEAPQLVNSEAEENKLGADWKDAPQMITAPNAEQVSEKKRIEGTNWRAAASLPSETVNEHHVMFAQSQGMTNIATVIDLYKFLATLTGAQMQSFMKDAAAWKAPEEPRGPGRPKSAA